MDLLRRLDPASPIRGGRLNIEVALAAARLQGLGVSAHARARVRARMCALDKVGGRCIPTSTRNHDGEPPIKLTET